METLWNSEIYLMQLGKYRYVDILSRSSSIVEEDLKSNLVFYQLYVIYRDFSKRTARFRDHRTHNYNRSSDMDMGKKVEHRLLRTCYLYYSRYKQYLDLYDRALKLSRTEQIRIATKRSEFNRKWSTRCELPLKWTAQSSKSEDTDQELASFICYRTATRLLLGCIRDKGSGYGIATSYCKPCVEYCLSLLHEHVCRNHMLFYCF